MLYFYAHKICDSYLFPFLSYGTSKFSLDAYSGRYLSTDTFWPYEPSCKIGSLCDQGFLRYQGSKIPIEKGYSFGLEKSLENWLER